jgi:hypothetical protein
MFAALMIGHHFSTSGFCCAAAALVVIEHREIVQRYRDVGMAGAERLFEDRQRFHKQVLGQDLNSSESRQEWPAWRLSPRHH